jgi:chromate transport protein ChrA
MMHQELVEKRRWISEHRYLHGLNFCMLLPGPEAIQLAIYISWLMHGVKGAVMAGVLFFLPAFLLLSLLASVYLAWGDVPLVQGIFYGIKPAVVAVVLFAAWRIGSRALKNEVLWGMAALAFIGIFFFDIGFPWIVLAAAILGAIGGKLMPAKVQGRRRPWRIQQAIRPGDHRRRHAHARPREIFLGQTGTHHSRICRHLVCRDIGDQRPTNTGRHGQLLHQGRFPDYRRCVRRAAVCVSRRGGALRLADRPADDGRPGTR